MTTSRQQQDAPPEHVLRWLSGRHQAVLVTVRADGSPQTSNVAVTFTGAVAHVSVTDDRAKTRNLRRDPRAVLHVLGGGFGQYASLAADAEPGPVSTAAGDQAGRRLLELYESIRGPHDDPDEFLRAMVTERRLVLTLRIRSAVTWGI
jgi:PPOX class probable F420-dependent enzyme